MANSTHDNEPEPGAAMTSGFWMTEDMTPSLLTQMKLKTISLDTKSSFQRIQVVETEDFGKTLVLDGRTQSAAFDEWVYHETLVHPAMLQHPDPKVVFIGGGGELATAREVLRHRSVQRVVMCDIDKKVVDTSRELLPEWGKGCTEDPRLELNYSDAHAFLRESLDTFDLIIMDIADPIEAGPGYVLYTQEFYAYAATKLSKGGVLCTQSGPGALHTYNECFSVIHSTLRASFQHVAPFTVDIPSFGCVWAFNLAFNSNGDGDDAEGVMDRAPRKVDEAVVARIDGSLRFYDGVSHRGLFGTPKWLREALAAEQRIMTKETPVFMY